MLGDVSCHVLIIEDDMLVAMSLTKIIDMLGYAVLGPAPTASEAIALARMTRPDLILSDLNLQQPGDGARAVLAILAAGDIPVIFITAHADAVPRTEALQKAVIL